MTKKIAIIGAGPAGLVAAKSCLEAGMTPVVFEKSKQLGGVWSGGDSGLAWDGMHTNISRWSVMFSDFPWQDHIQTFPIQSEVADYLQRYSDAFGVTPHIHFSSEVSSVEKMNNGWRVTHNGSPKDFDAVIIASGFFSKEMMPDLPQKDLFKGRILHAATCRPSHMDKNARVTVYGGSLSGYELAMEFARVSARTVTHAFSRPSWVLSRHVEDDEGNVLPLDFVSYRRDEDVPPKSVQEARAASINFFKACFGNPGSAHRDLNMPETTDKPPYAVVSDGYIDAVRDGKIKPLRGQFNGFNKHHLLVTKDYGGIERCATDILVMATGYEARLPYLDADIKSKIAYDEADQFMPVQLHDTVWPKDIDGLAFVGFYRGPYFAVMELQARWVAGVLSGTLPAPTAQEIDRGTQAAKALKDLTPRPQFPYGDYVALADKLARHVGCYPQIEKDDKLYASVHGGFFLPSHYRLSGAHANRALAEQMITNVPFVR